MAAPLQKLESLPESPVRATDTNVAPRDPATLAEAGSETVVEVNVAKSVMESDDSSDGGGLQSLNESLGLDSVVHATLDEVDIAKFARMDESSSDATLDESHADFTLDEEPVDSTLDEDPADRTLDEPPADVTIDERATPAHVKNSAAARARMLATLPPSLIGDYEILGELGRGGMGVVYRARQRRANRIVALKLIRPDSLGSMSDSTRARTIDRFHKEAEAAGRLQHDNIVTVFEVGEANGCPFFSMLYVEGTSLSDRLRVNPIDNRQAAGYLEPICRAVHAAHQVGILHRDIKPQNILIENATNRPRIADFGLAKLTDQDAELTRSGETMGTPPYMPPEQFGDAANVTAAADIYALGATLYHVLSGRPPFQAASTIATMRQVLDKDPVRLRELNSAVDADLETICMKCLEKEPARRYATAQDLADELRRYLDGVPILSRPIGRAERLQRWCRRNPVIAGLIGAVMASILFAKCALGVAYVRTEEARKTVENSLEKTKTAQVLSEASFQDALSAVNEFFTRVSEDRLLNEPGAQGLRKELLQLAHSYYLRLLDRREEDPTVQEELAATHYRIGLIVEELESPQAALASYNKAREMLETQLKAKPDSKPLRQFLSNTFNALGRAQTRMRELDRAEESFKTARRIRAALADETPDAQERFEFDRLLASVDMNLGLLEKQRGELDEAQKSLTAAQTFRLQVLPVKPKDKKLRRDLAKGDYNLANLALDRNDIPVVKQRVREAIRRFEELLAEDPDDLEDRHMLAMCYRLLGDDSAAAAVEDAKSLDVAIDSYSRSRVAMEKLVARNPAVPRYRYELAQLLLNLAQLELQRVHADDAIRVLSQAETLLVELLKEFPQQADYSQTLQTVRDLKSATVQSKPANK